MCFEPTTSEREGPRAGRHGKPSPGSHFIQPKPPESPPAASWATLDETGGTSAVPSAAGGEAPTSSCPQTRFVPPCI